MVIKLQTKTSLLIYYDNELFLIVLALKSTILIIFTVILHYYNIALINKFLNIYQMSSISFTRFIRQSFNHSRFPYIDLNNF